MLVGVLHGPNFNVLDRRDPAVYGGPLAARARGEDPRVGGRARLRRPLPPDEPRGRVRRVVPGARRLRRRAHRQLRRLVALQLRDPRRARAGAVPGRRGAPLGHREQGGVAATHGHRRHRGAPGDRQGPRRLQGGAGIPDTRIDRLRGLLEEPLLVTAPTNVLYLTGFESSNAAVLVAPDRPRSSPTSATWSGPARSKVSRSSRPSATSTATWPVGSRTRSGSRPTP